MNSILNLIKNRSLTWNYYDQREIIISTFLDDYSSQSKHKEFIREYLKAEDKEAILSSFEFKLEVFDRAIHTNGIFFSDICFMKN